MELKQIVKDVLKDFNRDSGVKVKEGIVEEFLLSQMKSIGDTIDEENAYAICMYSLYWIIDETSNFDDISPDEINQLLAECIIGAQGEILGIVEQFKWMPETLIGVYKDSYELFEMAKQAYFDSDEEYAIKVDILLGRIESVRSTLESENYLYRSKQDIIQLYEHEVSECQLDVDTTKGNRHILSFRLSEYVDDLNSNTGDVDAVDLEMKNPFSMPQDLFGE